MDETPSTQAGQVELRYRKLVENLPGCVVFVLDQNLRVTFAGGGVVAAGFRPHFYFDRAAVEVVDLSVYAFVEPYLLATLGGQETRFEFDYPAGPSFEVRTTPLQDDKGPAAEILVVALDTTARVRSEAAEQAAQRVLQRAAEAANVGLWDVDLLSNRVHYSRQWKQQLGYEDDEIGDSLDEWERRLHPDDLVRARNLALAYLAGAGPSYEQEFRLRHKDGSYRWILARGTVECDAGGRPAHALGVHIDITEKKRAEEALAEERDRLATVLDSLPVGVWIAAQDGRVVAKNRQVDLIWHGEAPLSASVEEYTDYAAWDTVTGEQLVPADYPTARALRTGEPSQPRELRIRRFDGSEGTVLVSAVPLRDGQGQAAGVVAVNVDISARKQAEEALRASEAALMQSQAVAHIGHWAADKQRKTLTWSDEMKHILGLDVTAPLGDLDEVLRRAIHPHDLARVRELRARMRAGQAPATTEFRVLWPDGTIRYICATADVLARDDEGNVLRHTGIMQDITERKLRELENEQLLARLQSTAEQLAQVVDCAPDAVLLLDTLGSVLLTNPKADTFLGQQAEYDEQGRVRLLAGATWQKLQATPQPGHWHTLRTGQHIFEAVARPVDPEMAAAGWVVIVRDVTVEHALREDVQAQHLRPQQPGDQCAGPQLVGIAGRVHQHGVAVETAQLAQVLQAAAEAGTPVHRPPGADRHHRHARQLHPEQRPQADPGGGQRDTHRR